MYLKQHLNNLKTKLANFGEIGNAQLLLLVGLLGVLGFIAAATFLPTGNKRISSLFPKENSQAAGTIDLSINPSQVNANEETTFNVNIDANSPTATISAVSLKVSFDPQFLRANSITSTGFLPTVLSPGTITENSAQIDLGANPTQLKSGGGTLAVISFTALRSTSSASVINFDPSTQVAAIGLTGDQTGTLSPANVTINPAPTPTPLPTPTPTPLDTTNPQITITSPQNGQKVARKSNVTISANASDNIAVTKVEFYLNNSLLSTDANSPYSANWNVPTGKPTTYTISAKAYDARGNNSTSTINVTSN